jgi:VWFA-related protein
VRRAWRLALLLAPAVEGLQPAPPVFPATADAVFVDVFVERSGRPVTGLRAEHFELREDGRLRDFELLRAEALPLRVLLVFDESASMSGARLEALREAGRRFLDSLRPEDEAGLVSFSDEVVFLSAPHRDRARTRAALDALAPERATSVWDALYAGVVLAEAAAHGVVVLFSDGQDNSSWLSESQLRTLSQRSHVVVHVVGLREGEPFEPGHVAALRGVAERTGGALWEADDPSRLAGVFAAIAEATSARYLLRFEPAPSAHPGWHRLEVKLRGAKGALRARPGYWLDR